MNRLTPTFLLSFAACFAVAQLQSGRAQSSAFTDPVGYVTTSIPAATGAKAGTRTLSFPLYRRPVAVGAVTEATGNTCRLSGTEVTSLDVVAAPYLLRVKASQTAVDHVGRFYLIVARTGDQLTLGGPSAPALSVNDTCEVVPANTLANVFGTPPPVGWVTGTVAAQSDNIFLWNPAVAPAGQWEAYYYHSTNLRWEKAGTDGSQNSAIIYPDEGIFLSRIGTSPVSLTLGGTAPTTNEQSELNAGATCVANRFPVDVKLGSIGFENIPGWVSAASAGRADNVYLWSETMGTWEVFYYNSTNARWQQSPGFGSKNDKVIPAGTALFVKRASVAEASFTQTLPYAP